MALTNDELLILQSELTNDPLNRNYQTMSDQEVEYDLRNVAAYGASPRQRIRALMTSTEVFNSIDLTEFNALTDHQRSNIMGLMSFGNLNPDGREKDLFVNYFGAGSNTLTALNAARMENISRCVELNIPNVYAADVNKARNP